MARIKIDGIPALDGEYEFDLSYFTNGELHAIKKETGLRAGEFEEAIDRMDNDMVVAMAATALGRVGRGDGAFEILWGAKIGTISLVLDDEEDDDALPPTSGPDSPISGDERPDSSGDTSSDVSDVPPAMIPVFTGFQPSGA